MKLLTLTIVIRKGKKSVNNKGTQKIRTAKLLIK